MHQKIDAFKLINTNYRFFWWKDLEDYWKISKQYNID